VLGGPLLIASAGLGLVDATTAVPTYEATAATGTPDSIGALLTGGTINDWWSALCSSSPFSTSLERFDGAPLLVAVSSTYFEMMRPDLESWAIRNPGSLRLFVRVNLQSLPDLLRPYHMPYDLRLNDPAARQGTEGDFVQRALADFAEHLFDRTGRSTGREDAERVRARLTLWQAPDRQVRIPATDDEISSLIQVHWDSVSGRSGAMLRKLRRELGVSCEQGRFKTLFNKAKAVRKVVEIQQTDFFRC
jgi:hypothetical protein